MNGDLSFFFFHARGEILCTAIGFISLEMQEP